MLTKVAQHTLQFKMTNRVILQTKAPQRTLRFKIATRVIWKHHIHWKFRSTTLIWFDNSSLVNNLSPLPFQGQGDVEKWWFKAMSWLTAVSSSTAHCPRATIYIGSIGRVFSPANDGSNIIIPTQRYCFILPKPPPTYPLNNLARVYSTW